MPERRTIIAPHPIDLARTLFPLRRGKGDPTTKIAGGLVLRATRTPEGPATIRARSAGETIDVEAWGPGAAWILDGAAGLVGATDDDTGFEPHHPVVADAWRRHRGVRITHARGTVHVLIPVILEQKVTGIEARRAYRSMARALGEPAPGPFDLVLPPDPERVAALPYFAFHPWGVERRRAELIRAVCRRADQIERAAARSPAEVASLLQAFSGIGPWTVAEIARIALGDADAVSVGDFHLPHLMTWALAHEPRGTDERMLELLAPYAGHRGRVQLLLEASGLRAPAFGPKSPVRSIASL